MCHMSHVTCLVSHVACHMSCVTCPMSHVKKEKKEKRKKGQSGGAYRSRVCYQRGLPRLVKFRFGYIGIKIIPPIKFRLKETIMSTSPEVLDYYHQALACLYSRAMPNSSMLLPQPLEKNSFILIQKL